MGITDSKMLAEKVLTACEAAQTQGKCELDVDSFWSDEVAKKIFQHIPRRIRGTVRQNAAERAAVRSGSKIIIPRVVKDIQANQTRVLEEQGSRQEIYMSILQRGYLQNQSTKHSSLAGCYMLMEDVEKENDVGLIRLRFHCLLFYHLKQYIQPNGFWNDSISFMVEVIGISGLVEDSKDIIREKLVAWTDKGKRYALLARDLGGLGSLLVLPGDIPESVWVKDLPKSADNERRIGVLDNLKGRGIIPIAESLNMTAQVELDNLWNQVKVSVDMEVKRQRPTIETSLLLVISTYIQRIDGAFLEPFAALA